MDVRGPTRYAAAGEFSLAHQVVGEGGGVDVVLVPTLLSHVEHLWEHPAVARSLTRLAGLGRILIYDRRGVGLSDATPGPRTLAGEVDDLLLVMGAAGFDTAAVVGYLHGGPLACLLAATHPQRVRALVLDSCFARVAYDVDYDWPMTPEQRADVAARHQATWGEGARAMSVAPSLTHDARSREWLCRLERLAASPHAAARLNAYMSDTDVRAVLPAITAPTLVTRRAGDTFLDRRHALHLVEHIPGAELRELEGPDALWFASDADAFVDAVGTFVAGRPPPAPPSRILATLLFTDIVDSTATLARLGDSAWRELLVAHDAIARRAVERHGGREVKTLGDGIFATFPATLPAIESALDLVREAGELGIAVRAGVHSGECEVIADDLAGRTVHEAARVAAQAGAGEVLVSDAARGLVGDTNLGFADRGRRELKGLPGEYRLWAVSPLAA